jgi:hypothetical protein
MNRKIIALVAIVSFSGTALARDPNIRKNINCNWVGRSQSFTKNALAERNKCFSQKHHVHSCLHRIPGCVTVGLIEYYPLLRLKEEITT